MSTLAVIVIVVIAVLLAAMLILAGRRAARVRAHRDLGPVDYDIEPYRSHAEASRRSSTRTWCEPAGPSPKKEKTRPTREPGGLWDGG